MSNANTNSNGGSFQANNVAQDCSRQTNNNTVTQLPGVTSSQVIASNPLAIRENSQLDSVKRGR
jgi:hypothetical protein